MNCAPACHCACSPATFVPVMYNPALFSTITSSSSSARSSRLSPSTAAPLLVPKPKPKPKPVDAEEDDLDRGCPGLLCSIGIAGLVVLAFILVILFV